MINHSSINIGYHLSFRQKVLALRFLFLFDKMIKCCLVLLFCRLNDILQELESNVHGLP